MTTRRETGAGAKAKSCKCVPRVMCSPRKAALNAATRRNGQKMNVHIVKSNVPPADARMDLFLSADGQRGGIELGRIVGVNALGTHSRLIPFFTAPGRPPLMPFVCQLFYEQ